MPRVITPSDNASRRGGGEGVITRKADQVEENKIQESKMGCMASVSLNFKPIHCIFGELKKYSREWQPIKFLVTVEIVRITSISSNIIQPEHAGQLKMQENISYH
jgi:hypothetical protein